MLRKFFQIVLVSLVVMAILSPLLQLNSWDMFPVSSDDIENQVTYCLCALGMLVFTGILNIIPVLRRRVVRLVLFCCSELSLEVEGDAFQPGLSRLAMPLRI